MLDSEREMRLRYERQTTELQLMVDQLNDRLEEAGGLSSQQVTIRAPLFKALLEYVPVIRASGLYSFNKIPLQNSPLLSSYGVSL